MASHTSRAKYSHAAPNAVSEDGRCARVNGLESVLENLRDGETELTCAFCAFHDKVCLSVPVINGLCWGIHRVNLTPHGQPTQTWRRRTRKRYR